MNIEHSPRLIPRLADKDSYGRMGDRWRGQQYCPAADAWYEFVAPNRQLDHAGGRLGAPPGIGWPIANSTAFGTMMTLRRPPISRLAKPPGPRRPQQQIDQNEHGDQQVQNAQLQDKAQNRV